MGRELTNRLFPDIAAKNGEKGYEDTNADSASVSHEEEASTASSGGSKWNSLMED